MILAKNFLDEFIKKDISFFAGVPDSVLKSFISHLSLMKKKNITHRIATNEGSAISLGIGYNLSTKKIPLIYFQNSGLGHAANPLYTMADKRIYSIPMILMIGRRGFPKENDEPQHYRIGDITKNFLKLLDIPNFVLNEKNYKKQISKSIILSKKKSQPVALIVPMNFFDKFARTEKKNNNKLNIRNNYLKVLLNNKKNKDRIISSLGNVSRELFVQNQKRNDSHSNTFYSIGAMGHANQIALEISLQKKNNRTFILDGDGSIQMHLGNLLTIGKNSKNKVIHILFNNKVHESTGFHPLANDRPNYKMIFKASGYKKVYEVNTIFQFEKILKKKNKNLICIIVNINPGTIKNLPRPSQKPKDLKKILKF
jgi:phosphonopyruvate decarboxylase